MNDMLNQLRIPKHRELVVAGALLGLLFVGMTVTVHNTFTARFPGGNDMVPGWVATRAWLLEGLDPFDPEIDRRGQLIFHGRPATEPGEDPAQFLYFPYAMFFFAGVALLPFDWAHAAWMVVMMFCSLAIVIASMRMYRWRPPLWLTTVLMLWGVLAYPSARAIVLGQVAVVMILLVVLAWWAIREKRDGLAGVLLALSTAKPTVSFIIFPLIFLWSLTARRFRLAWSMALSMLALVVASFLIASDWPLQVYHQAVGYTSYTSTGSVVNILTHDVFPLLGTPAAVVLISILVGWMLYAWQRAREDDVRRLDWAFAVTLVVTTLVGSRTGTTSQPMLYPVLIMLFVHAEKWRGGWGRVYLVAALLVVAVGLWALFLMTIEGDVEQPLVFLPLPLGVAGALLLARAPRSAG